MLQLPARRIDDTSLRKGPITEIVAEHAQSVAIRIGDKAGRLPAPTEIGVLYSCPICRVTYPTYDEAEACRLTPFNTYGLEVGSLVIIPNEWCLHYTGKWYKSPADDPWVAF